MSLALDSRTPKAGSRQPAPWWLALLASALLGGFGPSTRAAEDAPADTTNPKRAQLRERLKNLTPEERRAQRQAWRDQQQGAAKTRATLTPEQRQELRALSPAERAAKREEWRKQRNPAASEAKGLSAEQREKVVKARQARLQQRLAELQKKRAEHTLTPAEETQLQRLERRPKQGAARPSAPATGQ